LEGVSVHRSGVGSPTQLAGRCKNSFTFLTEGNVVSHYIHERDYGPVFSRLNQDGHPNRFGCLAQGCFVLAICLLVGIPSAAFSVNDAPGSSLRFPVSVTPSAGSGVGQRMIEDAEASLQQGQGPAHGSPAECEGLMGSISCSTSAATPDSALSQPAATTPTFPIYATPSSRYGAPWTNIPDSNDSTDYLLLFGGASSSGLVFNDTWTYSYITHSWVNASRSSCGGESTPCPAGRHDESLVWDSEDNYTLMFGGCSAPTTAWVQSTPGCPTTDILGDTWKWVPSTITPEKGTWSQIPINGVLCGGPGQPTCSSSYSPTPRYAAGIADVASEATGVTHKEVVLYGGCGRSTCPLSDTWTFIGGAWTNRTSGTPSARYAPAMTYDLVDQDVLMFGGCGTSATGCTAAALYGDTWEFNSTKLMWTQVPVNGVLCGGPTQPGCTVGAAPSDRYFAMMSSPITSLYPGFKDLTSLFGGTTGGVSSTVLDDYWHFYAGTWISLPSPWRGAPIPTPRFDGDWMDRGATLDFYQMFGGTSPSGSSLGDTYLQTPTKSLLNSPRVWPPIDPPPSAAFSLAYDPANDAVVLFGGCGQECPSNETWIYAPCGGATIPMDDCSQVLAGTMAWLNLSGPAPPARTNAAMGYDFSKHELVLFGGVNANGTVLNDTWTLTWPTGTGFPSWAFVSCPPRKVCPSARQLSTMATFDGGLGAEGAVLFGGLGATGALLGDTWSYENGPTGWTKIASTQNPSARSGAGMGWDPSPTPYAVLFGGTTSTGLSQQTWALSGTVLTSLTWTQLTPASCTASTCPPAEASGGMDYDANDGYVVLFENGNPSCSISTCWTTWGFQGGAWGQKASPPSCLPTCAGPLTSAPIAYSASASYVVLFGGWSPNGSLDGGTYAWGNGNWVADDVANPAPSELAPTPLVGASMAYDAGLEAVILVGGCWQLTCNPDTTANPGMWAFQNGAWHFILLRITASNAPDRVAFASMAYFQPGNLMVLFGGVSFPGLTLSSTTWTLMGSSLQTLTWAQSASGQPTARWGSAMAYDPSDGYLVLFGGCASSPVVGNLSVCPTVLGDTWTFNGAWSNLGVISKGPPAGFGEAVASGPAGLYLVDGFGALGPMSDEWEFTNKAWTKLSVTIPFSARWGASMDFDTLDGVFVLFGGFGLNPSGGTTAYNDTWSELLNGNWNAVSAPAFRNPTAGFGSIVFDPDAGGNGLNLQFGGSNAAVWQVFGASLYFTAASGWVNISPWT
jgi:hypothetical protein